MNKKKIKKLNKEPEININISSLYEKKTLLSWIISMLNGLILISLILFLLFFLKITIKCPNSCKKEENIAVRISKDDVFAINNKDKNAIK